MTNLALVTGASSGIGREFARIHAAKGGDLVLVARRKERLEELRSELSNVSVEIVTADLAKENAPRQIVDKLAKKGLEVDILINNAGFGGLGAFKDRDWNETPTGDRAMIQVNIVALTALTRLVLPGMVERRRGRILNVSSTAALLPGPMQAVYYATKAYVTSFSNALAEELHDSPVTVTALMPGATESEFGETSGMDKTALFASTASAASVAKEGYAAMERGQLDCISGLTMAQRAMFAALPVTPKSVLLSQVRRMQEVK